VTAPETLARVEQACAAQLRDALPVTFTTIAEKSGISRTTLYRDESLRAVVVEYRTRSHDPRSLSGLVAEVGHLRAAVEALAERVRSHEEQLRRLNRASKAR
jgi:hypothetical protein